MTILNSKFNKKILTIFGLAIILGFMLGLRREQETVDITAIDSIIHWEILKEIILNNTIAFLLLCCSLIIGKSIIYMFFSINGFLIGTVIGRVRNITAIILLIPHGILEMGSFLFAGAILYHLLSENEKGVIVLEKKKYLNLFLISYFTLTFSALIEVFITPQLVVWVETF
ncbi:stage II sporulation protein M [Alkalibacterium olivapovliticus]|uniref:Stage II sporulation protein M n=1 Tax=Alkalibacterium olivapovliticus TaxID=99907 RepID=A0A2T0VT02_9LACT|nr:stage II sporulation protein M [Alkalibacterium olivapovliticus]PRY73725.1 stage II sporulation protein M [Alkalibacterium olivapovliticus]